MASIIEKIELWKDKHPDRVLYSFLDVDGNEIERYSYSNFDHRTKVIASNIYRNYKFKKGDRILLVFPPGIEMICAFFACTRLGIIPVPVYPPTFQGFFVSLRKLAYIADDCKAVAALTNESYYWLFKLNMIREGVTKLFLEQSYVSKLNWIRTDKFKDVNNFPEEHSEILFLQYTSGSTSNPKGVMVTHNNILHNCEAVANYQHSDYQHIGVSWLPQYHDMGLIGYYLFFALRGGTTYGFSPIDFIERPGLWLETITKYRATASSAPNFAYEYCLRPGKISEDTLERLDLSSLKLLMVAAEPIRVSTYQRFIEAFRSYGLRPESFSAAYGLAENTLAVSNCGRRVLAVDKYELEQNRLKITQSTFDLHSTTQLMSCGKPLGDIVVIVVDPEHRVVLPENAIGEIWISGESKCLGYWDKPELTREIFHATINNINGENPYNGNYLRTGDIGFIHKGEIYICGRAKDMIIIKGLNYFPQDIEKIIEESSDLIRKGCTAVFSFHNKGEEKLILISEVKDPKYTPDPTTIISAVRKHYGINVYSIEFIAPRSIPKTSSGKIARHLVKQSWREGSLKTILRYLNETEDTLHILDNNEKHFLEILRSKYNLSGTEPFSLLDVGVESLDLSLLINDIKVLLMKSGNEAFASEIDFRFAQSISISELFELGNLLGDTSAKGVSRLNNTLNRLRKEHHTFEKHMMERDTHLNFTSKILKDDICPQEADDIFVVGGTGFLGPYILKSLLEQTSQRIHVLVRAENETQGKERLRLAMKSITSVSPETIKSFDERINPIFGDLDRLNLGLNERAWRYLANNVGTIYHNGAMVNYLFNYSRMRNTNVVGTNEILKLAFEGTNKVFNHISTTFIFGWSAKETLYETDTNEQMEFLDFGYSQTKWVSEQLVINAMKQGLHVRIFRPALITPPLEGDGNNLDISIRLLAFMINHGIGVRSLNQLSLTPVNITANNIVAISNIRNSINKIYHVTRDSYDNIMDVIAIITKLTDLKFEFFDLHPFVRKVTDICSKDDILFPLLDFITRSVDGISSMQYKRYDNTNYQRARYMSEWGIQDPPMEDVVKGMLRLMQRRKIIDRF